MKMTIDEINEIKYLIRESIPGIMLFLLIVVMLPLIVIASTEATSRRKECGKSNMLNIGLDPVNPWELNSGERLYMVDKPTYIEMKTGSGRWIEGCLPSGTIVVAGSAGGGESVARRVYACGNTLSTKYPVTVRSQDEVKINLGLSEETKKRYRQEAEREKYLPAEDGDRNEAIYKGVNCLSALAIGWGVKSGNTGVATGGGVVLLGSYLFKEEMTTRDIGISLVCGVIGNLVAPKKSTTSSGGGNNPAGAGGGPGPDLWN